MSFSVRISPRITGAALRAWSDCPVVSPTWTMSRTPASSAIDLAALGRSMPSSAMPGETMRALTPMMTSFRD